VLPDPITVPSLLAHRASSAAGRAALVTADDSITYGQLESMSADRAASLAGAGVVKGDRVGLLAENGIDWAVTAFAVLRIGAVLVPLSTLLRPPELIVQLRTASVSHLVVTDEFRGRRYRAELDHEAPGFGAIVGRGGRHAAIPSIRAVWSLGGLPAETAPADVTEAMEHRVRPSDDMVVMFTSGSRGMPKGVIHTHAGALRATASGLAARGVGPGERLYIPMPFFWVGGFGGGLLSAIVAGATLLTEAEPELSRTIELLQREQATLFRGWPDQAARLAAHPSFASADLAHLGDGSLGAVLPAERRPAAGARANLFGMTESFGPYSGYPLDTDLPAGKWGSCGQPFDGVEVRVVEPEHGTELPAGGQGEIWLRGPNLLRGIVGRVRETVFTPDGFYRTGDLGRLDADGYLWFTGRLDDMFKVSGATVYPSEVEAALRRVPGVRQSYVTDVTGADGQREVGAVVVSSEPLLSISGELKLGLSAFKVPKRWVVTADPDIVPMLGTGKIDKSGLQRLIEERGGPTP
jgi:acyl-CoA synthetase (AMP-forming)/AMP-acid ligase II